MTEHHLAVLLLDPAKVIALKELIEVAFRSKRILSGSEISASLQSAYIGDGDGILEALMADQVVLPLRKSHTLQGTLFSLDAARARIYFEQEAEAALLASEMGFVPRDNKEEKEVEVVATLPPGCSKNAQKAGIGYTDAAIKHLIVSSTSSVWIACPYFDDLGNKTLQGALLGRARDNVKIRILGRQIGGVELEENRRSRMAIEHFILLLKSEGLDGNLEVRDLVHRNVQTGQLAYALHSKVFISDMKSCYVGSANVTSGSMNSNFELGVILRGPSVGQVCMIYEDMWRMANSIG